MFNQSCVPTELFDKFWLFFRCLIPFSFRIVKRGGFTISYSVRESRRRNPDHVSIYEIESSGYEELGEQGENQTYETIL